jgi:hypothetical protein
MTKIKKPDAVTGSITKVYKPSKPISELDNEKAKIHNLKAHIRFTIGDLCKAIDCPILQKDFGRYCQITRTRISIYNEVPFEIWQYGKLLERHEKGTWREQMVESINPLALSLWIPILSDALEQEKCPYNLGFKNYQKLRWCVDTYHQTFGTEWKSAKKASEFFSLKNKEMYAVLEYEPYACW